MRADEGPARRAPYPFLRVIDPVVRVAARNACRMVFIPVPGGNYMPVEKAVTVNDLELREFLRRFLGDARVST